MRPDADALDALPRFLRAIAEHVDPAMVEEIHLFAPIRQGGKESGVAVIAVRHAAPLAHTAGHGADATGPDGGTAPDAPDDSWLTTDPPISEDAEGEQHPSAEELSAEHALDTSDDDSPYRDEAASPTKPAAIVPVVAPPRPRLTVWRASYLWTQKGVDRGKWEVDVVAEADAPLATIDEVVRGVARRAGEADEPRLMSGNEFRRALEENVVS